MDEITQKREQVKSAYKSQTWFNKVDGMTDQQVVAIYLRLKGQGKI